MGLNQRLIKLVCVASSLSTQQYRVRDKTGWLGIRIMCLIQGRIQDFKLEGGALKKILGWRVDDILNRPIDLLIIAYMYCNV
jgi:hypothetical protein